MKILEKLGLTGKKHKTEGEPLPVSDKNAQSRRTPNAIQATREDTCCGSCGGQGHAEKKGRSL